LILTYLWIGASSSLSTASSELENLRSSYQDLETKFAEAEQKREQEEKQLAEKNSELIKKEGEFAMKRKVDNDTLQNLQKELNGLRKYMDTAEKHWDLLNADAMGTYPEFAK
jgi:flagellar biosynthesis chaperone FliJ